VEEAKDMTRAWSIVGRLQGRSRKREWKALLYKGRICASA
jgi:hypothetical protein